MTDETGRLLLTEDDFEKLVEAAGLSFMNGPAGIDGLRKLARMAADKGYNERQPRVEPDKIDDGGQAFPAAASEHGAPWPGMSLRDWFAGQALAGMMADSNVRAEPVVFAEGAYRVADAMLKARERTT